LKIFVEIIKHLIVDCPSFKRDGKIMYGIDGTKLPLGKADMGFVSKSCIKITNRISNNGISSKSFERY